jgi:hypothetical protein
MAAMTSATRNVLATMGSRRRTTTLPMGRAAIVANSATTMVMASQPSRNTTQPATDNMTARFAYRRRKPGRASSARRRL